MPPFSSIGHYFPGRLQGTVRRRPFSGAAGRLNRAVDALVAGVATPTTEETVESISLQCAQ